MPEFLLSTFTPTGAVSPVDVFVRLVVAVVLGAAVAWVYRKTRLDHISTFPTTLVLLAVLIAMVTQVIGDSVARAFSLVGALSIVRFRTVVRDTQDTAFVIFAVVIGMACGASDMRVALIGLAVVSAAAFAMRPSTRNSSETFGLGVRVATGVELDAVVGSAIDTFVTERLLTSLETARQGTAVEATYVVRLRAGQHPESLLKALNRIDGVQNVMLSARPADEPQP